MPGNIKTWVYLTNGLRHSYSGANRNRNTSRNTNANRNTNRKFSFQFQFEFTFFSFPLLSFPSESELSSRIRTRAPRELNLASPKLRPQSNFDAILSAAMIDGSGRV